MEGVSEDWAWPCDTFCIIAFTCFARIPHALDSMCAILLYHLPPLATHPLPAPVAWHAHTFCVHTCAHVYTHRIGKQARSRHSHTHAHMHTQTQL